MMKHFKQQFMVSVLTLAICILLSSRSQAAIIVSIDSVSSSQGANGFLDINLQNNSLVNDETISAFSIDLLLTGSGVAFTGIDSNTALPYVFGSEGAGLISSEAFPNTSFVASDICFNLTGFVTVAAGSSVGLGHIAFHVSNNTSNGFRTVEIVVGPGSEIVDADFNPLTFETSSGGVDVQGTPAVPEPATMVIWLVGMGLSSFGYYRQRR